MALGALVAVSMGVREAAGVLVGTLSVLVTLPVVGREAVGVLVDVLNAEVVPVSSSVESSVPSSTGGVDGSSDSLASVSNTCSVAAITV